ncbi:hypothetical protein PG994_000005 [Apiospora phragmitis]|uniref:Uncharacterized protein n=1 Tax=Apiospora phragmitis TaxID=2905665 RepID=A0ABR1X504_9PEZI
MVENRSSVDFPLIGIMVGRLLLMIAIQGRMYQDLGRDVIKDHLLGALRNKTELFSQNSVRGFVDRPVLNIGKVIVAEERLPVSAGESGTDDEAAVDGFPQARAPLGHAMRRLRSCGFSKVVMPDRNLRSMYAVAKLQDARKFLDGGRPSAELIQLQGLVEGEDFVCTDMLYDGACITAQQPARTTASGSEGKDIFYRITGLKNNNDQLDWAGAG